MKFIISIDINEFDGDNNKHPIFRMDEGCHNLEDLRLSLQILQDKCSNFIGRRLEK